MWLEANGFDKDDVKLNTEGRLVVKVDGHFEDTGEHHYEEIDLGDSVQTPENIKYFSIECHTCDDTGEVTTMEAVYPGEPHQAPVGTGTCPDCK